MKLTITNDRKEAGQEVYYVGALFSNIVAMLHERNLLTRAVELNVQPSDGDGDNLAKLIADGGSYPPKIEGES